MKDIGKDSGKGKRENTDRIRNTRPKDSGAKLIFDNHILCAQFLRGYTDVDLLKDVQAEDIEDITERFLWMWQEGRDSDSVKKIRLKGIPGVETLFLIVLIEHQSKVDHDMPFRMLRYIVQVLTDYAQEQEEKKKGITKTKGFRYPPILPVVFYDGPGKWTAETSFRKKVYLNEILGEYIPDFQCLVVPLSQYSARELVEKGDELSLFMLIDQLRSAEDFHKIGKLPEEYLETIRLESPESVLELLGKILSVLLLRMNVPKEEVEEFTDRIERRDFTVLFENFEEYDVQETRRVSRAEFLIEILEDIGPVPEEVKTRILSERDPERLKRWRRAAVKAESIEQFIEGMETEESQV